MAVAEAGKITVLLGKNGSGKTTLLKCIGGIRKINGGEIKLFGVPISEIKGSDRAKIVSFMPQYLPQLHISAAELVALGRSPYHGFINKLTENVKKIIDYAVTVTDTSKHLDDAVCTLSGGERQLAFLAMALSQDSDIIMLDEPTASLDAEYRHKVYRLIGQLKQKGKTVVVTMHDLEEAVGIADRIVVIDGGQHGIFGQCRGVCFRRYSRKSFFGNTQTFYRRKRKRGSNRFSFVIALALPCGRSYVF